MTTAIEGLDGVQSVSVKKGAKSTITMNAGKTLTRDQVQKALSAAKKNSPYKVTSFAQAGSEGTKKADSPKKSDKKAAK